MKPRTDFDVVDLDEREYKHLMSFLKASARPETSASAAERHLLSSLALAIRANYLGA